MENNKNMEDVSRVDSTRQLRVHFEPDVVHYRRRSSYSSSSSSPSSSSSVSALDDYVLDKEDADSSFLETKEVVSEASQGPLTPSEASPNSLPWSMQSGSSAQSYQAMGRPAGYDPSRIPANIFSSKPAAGMDWSVASNESLFSLHIGNCSFSRDFNMLNKSGELCKPGEIFKSGDVTRNDELFYIPTPLPSVTEAESVVIKHPIVEVETDEIVGVNVENISVDEDDIESVEEVKVECISIKVEKEPKDSAETEGEDETKTPGFKGVFRVDSKDKLPHSPHSPVSPRSEGSNHSTKSFQFPLLTGYDTGRNSPAKMISVKQKPKIYIQREMHKEEEPEITEAPVQSKTPKTTSWFSYFCCCVICR